MSKQDVLISLNQDSLIVPLSWAATTKSVPTANLGDALSPVIVSALSGIPSVHRSFDSKKDRLVCVGTIGHAIKNGTPHFWGTGVDKTKNSVDPSLLHYVRSPNTTFCVHALRGPFSAQCFRNQGIEVPEVYGDPIWFLPSIVKPVAQKKYELGIILHLSELTNLTEDAQPLEQYIRYSIPESLSSKIKIITTVTQPTFQALESRVQEITSCKRIASTSLHGLVIAETYGIPCTYFRTIGSEVYFANLNDDHEIIDHRIRDFYTGVGCQKLFIYGQERNQSTNWDHLIDSIDKFWQPFDWSAKYFLESFPLPLKFNPLEKQEFQGREILKTIKF